MARRRAKRKLTVIILLVLVLPSAAWFYRDYALGKRLQAELAALQAQGMPVSLPEAAPKPVPDDQNAAVLYQEVFQADFKTGERVGLLPHISSEDKQVLRDFPLTLNPTLADDLRRIMSAQGLDAKLATIEQASQRPHCVFPVHWEDAWGVCLPHLFYFREISYVIVARAALLALDGDVPGALRWHEVILRMSEHACAEPLWASKSIGHALRFLSLRGMRAILEHHDVPVAAARQLGLLLRGMDLQAECTEGMIGERAFGLDYYKGANEDPYALIEVHNPTSKSWEGMAHRAAHHVWWRAVWKSDELAYLTWMDEVVEISRLAPMTARPGANALRAQTGDITWAYPRLSVVLASLALREIKKRDRAIAEVDLCRIVLELKMYKREHSAYPASLAQLQPTLDWQIPKDPFTGRSYVYAPAGGGFILYSIGPDLTDEGGLPEYDEFSYRRDTFDIVWQCTR